MRKQRTMLILSLIKYEVSISIFVLYYYSFGKHKYTCKI